MKSKQIDRDPNDSVAMWVTKFYYLYGKYPSIEDLTNIGFDFIEVTTQNESVILTILCQSNLRATDYYPFVSYSFDKTSYHFFFSNPTIAVQMKLLYQLVITEAT